MESEIKLRLNNREQAEYIQNDDWFEDFAPHEPEVLSMRTTYLDTPDADLRKNQVMLRMREEGDVQVVTCKIGTMKGEDGFYQHLEWNLTLDEALNERIREEGLQDVFMDMADGDGDDELNAALRPYRTVNLVPVVEAAFERLSLIHIYASPLIRARYTYTVIGTDTDILDRLTWQALFSYKQESATVHAYELGTVSYTHLD